jgi:hypothetical protein
MQTSNPWLADVRSAFGLVNGVDDVNLQRPANVSVASGPHA